MEHCESCLAAVCFVLYASSPDFPFAVVVVAVVEATLMDKVSCIVVNISC